MSKYTDAVSRGLQGMEAVSSGVCPGCEHCADDHQVDLAELRKLWESGYVNEESSFSWRPCGICGTTLGGDRYCWHWIDPNDPEREINHESDLCTDCVIFLANGEEPEDWRSK